MEKLRKLLIPVLLVALTATTLVLAVSSTTYLPFVSRVDPTATSTSTATITPTPTVTPTPTSTPTPTPTNTLVPGVYIKTIDYDPDGDPVEDEYIEIVNTDNEDIEMTGWFINAERANFPKYFFQTFTLGAGDTVRVWSGFGTDTSTDLYWGSDEEIWIDGGDCAYLKDDKAETVDIYCYGFRR